MMILGLTQGKDGSADRSVDTRSYYSIQFKSANTVDV